MTGKRKKILNLTVNMLVGYLEALNGLKLYRYQRHEVCKLFKAVLLGTSDEITELWSRQSGKTELGRMFILTCMVFLPALARQKTLEDFFPQLQYYKFGFEVGFVAPKLELASIPFDRLRSALSRGDLRGQLYHMGITVETSNSVVLSLSNGSRAKAMSGADTSFNEGETFHYLHFEECQQLSQFKIYKSFHPMLASTGGCNVKVGTPATTKGAFYDAIQRNKLRYPDNHGEYPWQFGAAENDRYHRFVLSEMERLGAESEEFRLSYMLEWVLSAGMLFTIEQWKEMVADGKDGRPLFHQGEFTPGKTKVYGLDTGKHNDATVLTMGEAWGNHIRIIDWVKLDNVPYEDQYDIVESMWTSIGPGVITVDSTGAGDPVAEAIASRLGEGYVEPLTYSIKSKDTLCKHMKTESAAGRLFYPGFIKDAKLFSAFEKECLECEVEARGNLQTFHHPTDGDAQKHDDFVDSMANMIYSAVEAVNPQVYGGIRY